MGYTRAEAERAILEHLRAVAKIAKDYAPESDYITMSVHDNFMSLNNDYFEDNVKHTLRCSYEFEYGKGNRPIKLRRMDV